MNVAPAASARAFGFTGAMFVPSGEVLVSPAMPPMVKSLNYLNNIMAKIEALNAGTPVVATRHAGIPHMVEDGREALLVPPRDPAAIAAAVRQLNEPTTWHGFSVNARRRFVDEFSPDAVRAQWLQLLNTSGGSHL